MMLLEQESRETLSSFLDPHQLFFLCVDGASVTSDTAKDNKLILSDFLSTALHQTQKLLAHTRAYTQCFPDPSHMTAGAVHTARHIPIITCPTPRHPGGSWSVIGSFQQQWHNTSLISLIWRLPISVKMTLRNESNSPPTLLLRPGSSVWSSWIPPTLTVGGRKWSVCVCFCFSVCVVVFMCDHEEWTSVWVWKSDKRLSVILIVIVKVHIIVCLSRLVCMLFVCACVRACVCACVHVYVRVRILVCQSVVWLGSLGKGLWSHKP